VRRAIAPSLALAGGIGAIAGSFLAWAEISVGPVAQQAKGVDGWEGKLAVAGGVVLLAPALRAFAGAADAVRGLRGGLVGGLMAAGPALYDAATLNDQFFAAAADAGIPESVAREALESGRLDVGLMPGLWLVVIAGTLGIVAALLAMAFGSGPAPSPAGPDSGVGLRGWQATPGPGAMPASSAPPDAEGSAPAPSPWAGSPPAPPPRPDIPSGT
jgi:hypothetical protein